MRIIAYTYEADVHCVDCAKRAYSQGNISLGAGDHGDDEHGLPQDMMDGEANPVHPVFSTDEQLEPLFCGDCGEEIE